MDEKNSTRIVCEGGLDTTNNYLNLSMNKPGSATRLVNYEVGLTGGYTRLQGYAPYDETYDEVGVGSAEGKVLGIIFFENTASGATDIIAARKDTSGNTYSLYLYAFGSGWGAISTGLTHNYISGGSTVDKLRWDVGNNGAENVLCIVDGVNNALLYDGTTWAFIDSSDTGASMANAGGAQAIDAPTYVSFFRSTLFLAHDVPNDQKGLIAHSAPINYHDWTSGNGAGQITPGMEVVQIKPFRDSLYVFGYNRIKKIVVESTTFLVNDVTNNIGVISSDTVVEVGGNLVFLSPDGFRPIAGTDKIGDVELANISKPIQNLVKTRLVAQAGTIVNSVVIKGKSQFRLFFGNDTKEPAASKGLIGGLRSADQTEGWEFGELLGIRASCAASAYISGAEIVLHGDYDGIVYRQEYGNNFNGANIVSSYSTPYIDFGDTEIRKVIEKVNTFLRGEGSIQLVLGVKYDWGRTEITSPSPYAINVEAIIAEYDDPDSIYDDAGTTYGGLLTPVSITNLEGSFFSTQLTFTTNDTNPAHTIHALVIEYAPKGRR